MKQFLQKITKIYYRIAIFQGRGGIVNIEADDMKELQMILDFRGYDLKHNTWTLYKYGPLCLPEREIERSNH